MYTSCRYNTICHTSSGFGIQNLKTNGPAPGIFAPGGGYAAGASAPGLAAALLQFIHTIGLDSDHLLPSTTCNHLYGGTVGQE